MNRTENNISISKISVVLLVLMITKTDFAQKMNTDVTTPLHLLKPDYIVPYKVPTISEVTFQLNKVYNYLNEVTPNQFINKQTGAEISVERIDTNAIFKLGDFRLTSYEWGVTYAGMLAAGKATGDVKFTNYTIDRLQLMANAFPYFKKLQNQFSLSVNPLKSVVAPNSLDDAGAMCAAIIKTIQLNNANKSLQLLANNFIDYISLKQFRLNDGTFARKWPYPNSLWLDDLYMSVPALAQAGKLTGNKKYYDDAIKQVFQFSKRMFNKEKNVYMHGWIESMKEHPQFHWARANGWALMAMVELLDVLPSAYPGRDGIIHQLQLHVKGLAAVQSDKGFWHQLLDKNDSYLETSATAMYCFAIAKAINHRWIDAKAYTPVCILAWNALTTKINAQGQVEGTCVGTGMAFDPSFYYYRPINNFAAHGYGPVLLAGAEVITLLQQHKVAMFDNSIQLRE